MAPPRGLLSCCLQPCAVGAWAPPHHTVSTMGPRSLETDGRSDRWEICTKAGAGAGAGRRMGEAPAASCAPGGRVGARCVAIDCHATAVWPQVAIVPVLLKAQCAAAYCEISHRLPSSAGTPTNAPSAASTRSQTPKAGLPVWCHCHRANDTAAGPGQVKFPGEPAETRLSRLLPAGQIYWLLARPCY